MIALVRSAAAVVLLATVAMVPGVASSPAAAQPVDLAPRALLAMVASDPRPALPEPHADFCPGPNDGTAPPNSVLGNLSAGGAKVPAGTVVQLFFDGKAGPAAYTREAGGYRVDYPAGGQGCANQVGAAITVAVLGQVFDPGVHVGDEAARPFLRYNIAIP